MTERKVPTPALYWALDALAEKATHGTTLNESKLFAAANLFIETELRRRDENDFVKQYTAQQRLVPGRRFDGWRIHKEAVTLFRSKPWKLTRHE